MMLPWKLIYLITNKRGSNNTNRKKKPKNIEWKLQSIETDWNTAAFIVSCFVSISQFEIRQTRRSGKNYHIQAHQWCHRIRCIIRLCGCCVTRIALHTQAECEYSCYDLGCCCCCCYCGCLWYDNKFPVFSFVCFCCSYLWSEWGTRCFRWAFFPFLEFYIFLPDFESYNLLVSKTETKRKTFGSLKAKQQQCARYTTCSVVSKNVCVCVYACERYRFFSER